MYLPFSRKISIPFEGFEKIKGDYSQTCQDIFVLSATNGKRNGKYFEIGANKPCLFNNTYLLQRRYNWSGVSLEIDKSHQQLWSQYRPNDTIIFQDALTTNYDEEFQKYFDNKVIDYLQVDIEPSRLTVEVLLKLPFDKYEFSTITFETDLYRGDSYAKDVSREYLKKLGYTLLVGDVLIDNQPYEDWWIKEHLVDMNLCDIISEKSKKNKHPNYFLFDI